MGGTCALSVKHECRQRGGEGGEGSSSGLKGPAVTPVCLGLCSRTMRSPGMAKKRRWFHSSGSCLRWFSGCGLGGAGRWPLGRLGKVVWLRPGTGCEGAEADGAVRG